MVQKFHQKKKYFCYYLHLRYIVYFSHSCFEGVDFGSLVVFVLELLFLLSSCRKPISSFSIAAVSSLYDESPKSLRTFSHFSGLLTPP